MKKAILLFLSLVLCLTLFACNDSPPPVTDGENNQTEVISPMKIMSYNVQTGTEDSVRSRLPDVVANVNAFSPDVLGTQELNAYWITALTECGFFDTYAMVGEPRSEADSHVASNEYSAIFYKKEVFDLVASGTYWLSETPAEISRLDSCDYNRIMTYAVLSRKSDGYKFVHVNTHLEWAHKEVDTNLLQVGIMLDMAGDVLFENGDMPVIFTGDFNATVNSPGYNAMLDWGVSDARYDAEISTDNGTFSDGEWVEDSKGNSVYNGQMIDFCFTTDYDFTVERFAVGNDLRGSDHFPICIDLTPAKK